MASSKSFIKSSIKQISSKRGSKKDNSTPILIILGILLFIIIVGTIIYGSNKNREKFTDIPNKLVYLYMKKCGYCKDFNIVWDDITNEIKKKPETYKIVMEKYDLNDNDKGSQISKDNKIDYAPALILITPSKKYLYEGERKKDKIISWLSTKI